MDTHIGKYKEEKTKGESRKSSVGGIYYCFVLSLKKKNLSRDNRRAQSIRLDMIRHEEVYRWGGVYIKNRFKKTLRPTKTQE